MKQLFLQPVFIISALFVVAIAGAGTYISVEFHRNSRAKDEAVQSAQRLAAGHDSAENIAARLLAARTRAGEEVLRLTALTTQPSSPLAQAVVNEFAFERVVQAVKVLEVPIAGVAIPSVQSQIVTTQTQIAAMLEAWKQVTQNPAAAGTPAGQAAAVAYAQQIQQQLGHLQELVNGLDPGDSGLTPEELAGYQKLIDETTQETEEAIDDVNDDGVPPEVIEDQQGEVDEAQEEVEALEEELEEAIDESGDDDNNFPLDDEEEEFIPPPPPDPSLKPKIIEGSNTD